MIGCPTYVLHSDHSCVQRILRYGAIAGNLAKLNHRIDSDRSICLEILEYPCVTIYLIMWITLAVVLLVWISLELSMADD